LKFAPNPFQASLNKTMKSTSRTIVAVFSIVALMGVFLIAGTVDLTNLFDYENQTVPPYIGTDNTGGNDIENAAATLGRVLFYDKNLSSNNTVSCSSCHQQQFAFSDLAPVSQGVNGVTGRHSMRLINSRFSNEPRFFWDERAVTLEEQVTQPIQDHGEMGFSGTNGDPDFGDLITKMEGTPYYKSMFTLAFGDSAITEARMKLALAQFIRSIQSFDSKFDAGLAAVNGNLNANFPNFTGQENAGKGLFLGPPQFQNGGVRVGGGLGCGACHQGPELSIDPQGGGPQRNNGVITVAGDPNATDLTNSRSPTLRDMFSPAGLLNGPLMHDGSLPTIEAVLDHYNDITFNPGINPNLDARLRGGQQGPGQKLMMTAQERAAVEAFLKTLSGNDVYTNERWSDPFDADGTLALIGNVEVNAIEVSDASGQRSYVESVTVRFQGDVTIQPGAILVRQRSTATEETFEDVSINVTETMDGGNRVATIEFSSHVRNAAGVLNDGNYQLTLVGHLILRGGIPMGTDLVFGDEEADGLFSFFGDSDGDRDVDNVDLAAFLGTYDLAVGDAGFDPQLDYDADGDVDNVDLANFLQRYDESIPFTFDDNQAAPGPPTGPGSSPPASGGGGRGGMGR